MLRITLCILAIVLMIHSVAWSQDGLMKQAQAIFKPVPNVAPVIKGNPSNPGKISLGRMLYFDPRLSVSFLISCNTCHNIGLGGVDLQETSIGPDGRKDRGTLQRF
jgi:cytochrome c peroxidase